MLHKFKLHKFLCAKVMKKAICGLKNVFTNKFTKSFHGFIYNISQKVHKKYSSF